MTNDTMYDFESDLLAELRSIDRSAAPSRVRRRPAVRAIVPWAAVGGAFATAGAVTLTLLGGSAGSFPGWTASAGAATVPEVTSASAVCGLNPRNVILSQARGTYTVVMAKSGGVTTACLADTSQLAIVSTQQLSGGATTMTMSGDSSGGLDTWSASTLGDQADGALSVTGHMTVAGEGPLTVVEGLAPAGATAMSVVRSDGTTVEATVEGGEFFAWWPGSANPVSAAVTTASGTASQPFVTPPSALENGSPA
jgi:hypothetical protein